MDQHAQPVLFFPQHPWGHDVLIAICAAIGGPSSSWPANRDIAHFAAASTLTASTIGFGLSFGLPNAEGEAAGALRERPPRP